MWIRAVYDGRWCLSRICILLCIGINPVTAQELQGANWFFGKGAGITFKSGTVKSDTSSKIVATQNCGSISDAHGNLLFYTNGSTVWNRHHQVMPNGTGLLANDTNKTVLIQQKPGSQSLYYIFVANQPYLFPKQDTTGQLLYLGGYGPTGWPGRCIANDEKYTRFAQGSQYAGRCAPPKR